MQSVDIANILGTTNSSQPWNNIAKCPSNRKSSLFWPLLVVFINIVSHVNNLPDMNSTPPPSTRCPSACQNTHHNIVTMAFKTINVINKDQFFSLFLFLCVSHTCLLNVIERYDICWPSKCN